MVPHKRREGSCRDPASTQLFRGGVDEAADVCTCIGCEHGLKGELLVCRCREPAAAPLAVTQESLVTTAQAVTFCAFLQGVQHCREDGEPELRRTASNSRCCLAAEPGVTLLWRVGTAQAERLSRWRPPLTSTVLCIKGQQAKLYHRLANMPSACRRGSTLRIVFQAFAVGMHKPQLQSS